jgi:hypothetical protein
LPEAGSRSKGTLHGTLAYPASRQRGKEGNLDHRKIHVVGAGHSPKNTSETSAKRSSDFTDSADLKRVEAVRRQLKEALRELDQIEHELQGGCLW